MSRSFLSVYAELTCALKARLMEEGEEVLVGRACWLKSQLAIDKLDECNLCLQPWVIVPPLYLQCQNVLFLHAGRHNGPGPRWLPSEYLYLPVPPLRSLTHKEKK